MVAEQPHADSLFYPGVQLALIAADVDRVQSYVFESAKLTEMRGASLILDLLNVKDTDDENIWGDVYIEGQPVQGIRQVLRGLGLPEQDWPQGCVVYVAGGSALLIVPEERAEEVKQHIQQLYASTTLTATTTVVVEHITSPDVEQFKQQARHAQGEAWRLLKDNVVPAEQWQQCQRPDHLEDKHYQSLRGFGQAQSALGHRLRRGKQSKVTAPVFEVSPYTERCSYCHFRPAFRLAREIDERPICQACHRKRQDRGDHAAHSFYLSRFWKYLHTAAPLRKG
jgi:hypothetical protein